MNFETPTHWHCFDCLEGHTNEDLIRCGGEKEQHPIWGFPCDYCGWVSETRGLASICCACEKGGSQ